MSDPDPTTPLLPKQHAEDDENTNMSTYHTTLQPPDPRDSLELGSLASSEPGNRSSTDSSSSAGISSSRKLSLEGDDPLDFRNPAANARTPHNRSYSISSVFDFTSSVFPLSLTTGNSYAPIGAPISGGQAGVNGGSLEKHKTLTYLNGLSLVVGLIIGSGIFSSPSQVNINAGSRGASLVVWVVAGLLAWTGGSSFAELGGAIPLNGGAQVYLSKIFGELFGFLFTWCAVTVLKPGSTAIITIIMGEYLVRAAIGAEADSVSPWIDKGVAVVGLLAATAISCTSTRLGTKVGDMFMFLKFIALGAITIMGIVVAVTGFSHDGVPSQEWKHGSWFEGTHTSPSAWAVALYAGLWAFDGWDNTSYVVGEFKNPNRDLPKVIHTAMPLVIASYVLANLAYILVLPMKTINSSNTVAVLFGNKVFGPIGSLLLALVVSASCFGALNATTFTSGRLVYAAGKEGYLPPAFGKIGLGKEDAATSLHTRNWAAKRLATFLGDEETGLFYTPVNAMMLNMGLTLCYVIVGDFPTLVTFYGVASYTFYFLTVLGLIILRVREPNLERPYKTWIVTPIVFCCVSLFLLSRAVFAEPWQTLVVVAFIAAGVPIYFLGVRKGREQGGRERSESVGEGWRFWKRFTR